ncbi:MAG TPA: T9SS type A sorting domain-containing protein, partial [Chitinophagaceae bacterium]
GGNDLTKTAAGIITFGAGTVTLRNLSISAGTLTGPSGTMFISGNFSNSGVFTHNSGTVNYNNTSGGQSVAGVSYRNLTLSHASGTNTATGDVTVGGTFILSGAGAAFDMDSYALSVAGSFSSSGTVRTQNTSASPLPTGMSWGGTVEYYKSTGGQTVMAGNYTNLSNSNSSGSNTASGPVAVNGTLTVNSGGTFNMSTYALSGSSFSTSGTGTVKTQHIATASPLPANVSWTTAVEYAGAGTSQTVVAGTYSSLVMAGVSGPSMSGNVTVQGGLTLTSGILATGANTLTIQTNNISTTGGGSIDGTDGTVVFDYNGTINLPSANPFFGGNPVTNLTITGGAVLNLGSDETIEGVLSITSGKLGLAASKTLVLNGTIANLSASNAIVGNSTATIELRGGADQMGTIYFDQTTPGSSNTINNFAVNRDALADNITIGNKMRVRGVLTPTKGTVTSNGNLAIGSDATGSGRIYPEVIASNFQFVGDVSIERYAKDKNMRRYLFISSPVDGITIRNAWQDDIYITGVGTGGTPCGAGTGNGGANDRYNSNGFDATIANLVTIYTYDQNNSARWVAVPNTSTTLQKGKGYRVLYRGERGVNDANCVNYLTLNSPPSPSSATMNVAGAPTSGSFSVTVDGKTTGNYGYTLLGNPYACELNFSLFRAQNSTQIAPTYWTYDPNGQTNATGYLTVNNGTAAGYYHSDPSGNPANYPNPDVIASGQAFFVQSVTTGTVTFSESQKVNQSQAGVFKTANQWDSRIRVHFRQSDGTPIDNAVIRFSGDSTVTVQENPTWDAATMNGGNFVATIKGTRSFAIQTRPLNFFNDTVLVRIVSAAAGNFRLDFTDFDNFNEAAQIILLDLFTGTQADVKLNPVYPFTITSNAASQGGRFKLVFRSLASVLPLSFLNVSAVNLPAGVQVNWKLAFEQGVQQYLVERSANGQQFSVIGTVGSKGNSSMPVEYSFLDGTPLNGTSWYRIKSVEQGEGKYSPVVKVNSLARQAGLTIYPNPVSDRLHILAPATGDYSHCEVFIRSSEGRTLFQFRDLDLRTSQPDVSTLPAGIYFLSIVTRSGETLQCRFLKQ